MKAPKTTRRAFLRTAAASSLAIPMGCTNMHVLSRRSTHAPSPDGKLRIGGIGVGGKGWGDIRSVSKEKAHVVAVCDIDNKRLEKAAAEFPDAKKFTDWRKLLEMENLDAVTVSTPDHTHAPATMTAIRRGLHVYCQKPLTHSVWEARQIGLAAKKHNVVTQMGNQGHSSAGSRLAVKLLRRKTIGRIREVHMWTNRPIWPQGISRPETKPAPDTIDWDQWIGVAPFRKYHETLHPFAWRGWLDFGTGALGDMGCHALAILWEGLRLKAPVRVWSDGETPNGETYPESGVIHYVYPENELTGGEFRFTWYDGGNLPDRSLFSEFMPDDWNIPKNGKLIVGEEGCLYGHRLYPQEKFAEYEHPDVTGDDHYMQWTLACLDRTRKTVCPFDTLAGPMTEAVLLGNVALRFPGTQLEWDTDAFRFPKNPEADQFLRREYRKDWNIPGLG